MLDFFWPNFARLVGDIPFREIGAAVLTLFILLGISATLLGPTNQTKVERDPADDALPGSIFAACPHCGASRDKARCGYCGQSSP